MQKYILISLLLCLNRAYSQARNTIGIDVFFTQPHYFSVMNGFSTVNNRFNFGFGAGFYCPIERMKLSLHIIYQPRKYTEEYNLQTDSGVYSVQQKNNFATLLYPLTFGFPLVQKNYEIYCNVGFGFSKKIKSQIVIARNQVEKVYDGHELSWSPGQWAILGFEWSKALGRNERMELVIAAGGQFAIKRDLSDVPLKGALPYKQPADLFRILSFVNCGVKFVL
ncbi:MAG: hypothetical protein JNK73_02795 [Bacteroidia bacterium]|nr:hypothetical protein [Bacteroidia bacterium]